MSFPPLTILLSYLMQSTVLVDMIHLSSYLDCPASPQMVSHALYQTWDMEVFLLYFTSKARILQLVAVICV